ncbi:MAG TPA: hypothetical protein DIS88_10855 [Prevotella sp.]|nr:hypothetical protein [Prevotella sp.]
MSDRMNRANMNTNMEHYKNINYGHFKQLCDDIFIHEECLEQLWNMARGNSRYDWLKSSDFKIPKDFNSEHKFFESPKEYLSNYLSCLIQEEVNYEQNSESNCSPYINCAFQSLSGPRQKEPYRIMLSNLYDKNGKDIYIVIFTKENFEEGLAAQKQDLNISAQKYPTQKIYKKISDGLEIINSEWDEINREIDDPNKKVNFCICRIFSRSYIPSPFSAQSGYKLDMANINPFSTNKLKWLSLNLEDIEKDFNSNIDLAENIYNHCQKNGRLRAISEFIKQNSDNIQTNPRSEITKDELRRYLKESVRRARINPNTVLRIGFNSQTLVENASGQNDAPCLAQYVIPIYRGDNKKTPCAGLVVKVVDIASRSADAYNNQCVLDDLNNATKEYKEQILKHTTQFPQDWKVFLEKLKEQVNFLSGYVGVFVKMAKMKTNTTYLYPTICTIKMVFKDSLFYCNGDTNNWSYIPDDAKLDI